MRMQNVAALLLAGAASLTPSLSSAEDAAPEKSGHGYGGVGLLLSSNNITTPIGDASSSGGGLVINGAGVVPLDQSFGIGLTGGMAIESRTDSNSSETISGLQFGFDGGAVLFDLMYLSLGVQILNQTPDSSNITATYTVIPVGIGILYTDATGYGLAQLRFGGGQLSNDYNSSTEDVGFVGIRLAGQMGAASGLQFMGGMEFESYTYDSVDITDSYFRLFFGAGFGG